MFVPAPYPNLDGRQACAGLPAAEAAMFLPGAGADVGLAKAKCVTCVFLSPCRRYALERDVHGVWGGLDDADRRAYRRGHNMPAPRATADELDELILASRSVSAG